MEFLDDLLNPPEPEEAQQKQTTARATDVGIQPDRQTQATPGQREEAWTDLLEGVTLDAQAEAAVASKTEMARGHRSRGLSVSQKAVLGILGLVVVGIWAVIILLVSRSLSAGETDATLPLQSANVAEVSDADATQAAAELNQPTPDANTIAETPATLENTVTPTPQQAPTATPPAFTAFDRQIQAAPGDIELYLQRAEVYITLGAYQAALADLNVAKGLDDTRAEVYVSEGWTNFYTGHWQRAEDAFITAISFNQDLAEAHFGLGQLLFYLGRYKEAAAQFDWAAEINPGNAEAEAWLGISSAKLENKEEAYGAVGRAMTLTNTSQIVYIAQSWARRTESPPDIDGAQADLLYAQNLERNDFMTLNALAEFYVDYRPERLAEAEMLASYAYNWAGNDVERAVALQTLGRVYLQQNRKVDAERVFVEAADLTSRDGQILLIGLTEDLAKAKD